MTIDLTGKTALVTGSTDGVGRLVARNLGAAGAHVLVHGRDEKRGTETVAEIRQGGGLADFLQADLASLASVRTLAAAVTERTDRLHILINNAGIGMARDENFDGAAFAFADGKLTNPDFRFADRRRTSEDGHELFFAVNYVSSFLLTRLLLPLLLRSAPARIVNVASNGQRAIEFDDVMLEKGYDDFRAYCQSKLAMVMSTIDLAGELGGTGVTVNVLHPASRMSTGMTRYSGLPEVPGALEEGAAAILQLATSPGVEGSSGRYFKVMEEAQANQQAYDADARRRLRSMSLALTGLE